MNVVLRHRQSSLAGGLTGLSASMLGSLLAAGFSPTESFRVLFVTTWMVLIGGLIWATAAVRSRIDLAELLGAGMAVGTVIVALGNLLSRNLAPWWLVIIMTGAGLAAISARPVRRRLPAVEIPPNGHLAVLGAVPLIALLPFNLKTLPAALVILLALASGPIRRRLGALRPNAVLFLSVVPGLLTYLMQHALSVPPAWLDAVELDVVFDESLAFGLTDLGLSTAPTLLNAPVSGHFVSHATIGVANSVAGLPSFAMAGVGGYVLGVIGVSLIAYSLAIRSSSRKATAWVTLMVIFAQATVTIPVFFVPALRAVNAIAMLWLLFAILCHRRFLESSLSAGYWWLALSSSLALMGKFHWGIVYLAFVGTLPVAAALSRKPIARPVVAAAVSFTATGMMYLTFLGSPDGQAIEFGYRRDLVISGIAILLVRLIWSGSMGGTAVGVMRAVGVAAFFCVALWALIGGVYRTDFLFPAAAALTAVVVIPSVMNSLPETKQFHRFMIPLLAIGFVSGAALAFGRLIVTGVWRYDGEIPLGPFNRVWLPDALLVLSIIGIALVWKLAFTRRSAVNTLQFASLFAIVASLGAFAVQINKPIVHRVLFGADDFPSSIITEDQTAAGRWLAANAAPTDIAASNSLCPTELVVGEMVPDNDPENRCDGRNQNAWISALGNRQVLIESPAYGPLAYSQVKNPDHVIWYRSSVDFGRSADDSARQTLEEFEVRWFLVDLQLSDIDDWSIRKDTVYINDSYAIVDLEIRE